MGDIVLEKAQTVRGGKSGLIHVHFDCDRHARKRPNRVSPSNSLVGMTRCLQCLFVAVLNNRIDRRVHLNHACDMCLAYLDRGKPPLPHAPRDLCRG